MFFFLKPGPLCRPFCELVLKTLRSTQTQSLRKVGGGQQGNEKGSR